MREEYRMLSAGLYMRQLLIRLCLGDYHVEAGQACRSSVYKKQNTFSSARESSHPHWLLTIDWFGQFRITINEEWVEFGSAFFVWYLTSARGLHLLG